MSSENKRLTGACVPAVIDLFEDEPKSESVGLPSRNGSTKVHRINLSPSLPFSEDSEKGVLCSLVHSANEVAALCAASLQPEAFYLPAHQILYKLILEFVKDCKPIDFISLKQGLIDRSLIDEIGGQNISVLCSHSFLVQRMLVITFRLCRKSGSGAKSSWNAVKGRS